MKSSMVDKVFILPEVKERMQAYIDHCKFEISGLGMVEEREEGLVITEIFLLEQEGSGGSTTLDPAALAKFVTELALKGVDTSKLKFWWHSHVNFQCFWSGTDHACMDAFGVKDYFIATVGNKKGESRTRIDVYGDLRMFKDDVPLRVLPTAESIQMEKEVKAEIKEKVKEIAVIPGKWGAAGRNTGDFTRKTTVGKHSKSSGEQLSLVTEDMTGGGEGSPLSDCK